MNYYQIVAFAQQLKKTKYMAIYNNDRDPNEIMWEKQNKAFMNDPNEFTTDVMNEDSLMNQYFDMIKRHDYSHMFSDDDRYYTAGVRSEKLIKEVLHSLIAICRVDAERLLEDSISEVREEYTDGLTHRTIRIWFSDYIDNTHNINVKPYTKEAFKCVDGMYYAGDVFDIDGDGWVSEEQLELLLLEFNNGVK
jgi:hypothetical protein